MERRREQTEEGIYQKEGEPISLICHYGKSCLHPLLSNKLKKENKKIKRIKRKEGKDLYLHCWWRKVVEKSESS